MKKAYTSEQINRTKQLCELLNDIPDKKQEVVSIAMLSYMNGVEFGMLYSKYSMKHTQRGRRKSDEKNNGVRLGDRGVYCSKCNNSDELGRRMEE